ncbi:MAG: ABC transporter substrate-binding protein [Nitrospinaceae bacterium]|nr:ABC transporter substrate-binding protein [Nitrospinaceae bacterium]MBT3435186.1 ABC transporter substrate-binding protein [Nitrospinaceae bacterium]MBT3821467.1 ABC transporter substrate-binding protein [Nitrospinaceae bacterium]MBT4092659.1 ABC transporter substrate-binding protein [Nitrospinaceae bacterium]MBT4430036.1 ABC transporter substrate-binding protein [Nitrospinaceae bacterium]
MRKFKNLLSAVAVLAILLGFGAAPASAVETIVLGMPVKPPPMVHLPVYYAIDKGIFKLNGLNVKVKFFRGGVATYRAAVSGKSALDAAWVPAPIGMTGIAKGSGHKFFHSMAFLFEAQLGVAPGINTVKDLRGKTIGIEGRGGYSHTGALAVLGPNGLGDKDVKYIKTPPPARVPFLTKKKADAVLIHVEQVLLAKKLRPGVKAVASLWTYRPKYFYGAFMAHQDNLKAKRDAYVRFSVAMMQANRSIYKDKAGFLETADKWMKKVYKKHGGLLSQTYDTFVKARIWAVNNGMPKATVDWTNAFNKKRGKYKKGTPSYSDLIDTGIAADALKRVGGAIGKSEK